MKLARFLGICIVLGAAPGYAQVVPGLKPFTDDLVSNISQSDRDKFYRERDAARRADTPRILFVPGILGSKIDECRADGSQCVNIWGTVGAIKRRGVDLTVRSDRIYRTDVVDSVFFKDVYGGVLEYIRGKAEALVSDSADDALVTVFHYDWRRSNGDTAKLLKERICDVRARAPTSPIVIIAHSMGGLMTKVWAARHAQEPCADGKAPEVKQIVFVATPHLGSPKTVKAIADGYNILFDELTGLKRYLGLWERDYLLEAVNQAAISFPSFYELLPIRTSEYCDLQKPALNKASVPVAGDDNKAVNLFDVETWRRYDLMRRVGVPAVRQSYYDTALPKLLRQAELLLCEISDSDPAKVADVVYLFGREKDNSTYGWFHLRSGTPDAIDNSTTVQGDGTVPVYSAQNFLVSTTRQTVEVQADHTSIINSGTVLGIIDDLYAKGIQRADLNTARSNTQYASLLIAETAASGNLISVSTDPNAWTQEAEQFAIDINTKALATIGYRSADVARFASFTADPLERAKLYAIAASSTNELTPRLIWIGDVANSSYEGGQFQNAILNASFVNGASQKLLPSNDPTILGLQKAANEVEGWSYLREGDVTKFNEVASSYAAKYSVKRDEFREPTSFWNNDDTRLVKSMKPGKTIEFYPIGKSYESVLRNFGTTPPWRW